MIVMRDTCTLVELVSNGYGDKSVEEITTVACLFLQNSGKSHSGNVDIANSDAHIYLDIDNPVITERGYKIEGLLIHINPFGADTDETYYEITKVVVGQRKLTTNTVDNVHAFLNKVAKPNGV